MENIKSNIDDSCATKKRTGLKKHQVTQQPKGLSNNTVEFASLLNNSI